jgi:hypothetical protein
MAHLDGMLGVIAANAIDATDGKQVIAAADGEGRNGSGRKGV